MTEVQTLPIPEETKAPNPAKNLSMVVLSGDMDKAMAALIIATGAAAAGIQVTMFFTFWGLKIIQNGDRTGSSLFGRAMGFLNRGGIDRIGPSKFNFLGLGRWMFKKMMRAQNVATLPELLEMAMDLDVNLIACQMSMDVMEIPREGLIPGVSEVAGVAVFIEQAQKSRTTLFI